MPRAEPDQYDGVLFFRGLMFGLLVTSPVWIILIWWLVGD